MTMLHFNLTPKVLLNRVKTAEYMRGWRTKLSPARKREVDGRSREALKKRLAENPEETKTQLALMEKPWGEVEVEHGHKLFVMVTPVRELTVAVRTNGPVPSWIAMLNTKTPVGYGLGFATIAV